MSLLILIYSVLFTLFVLSCANDGTRKETESRPMNIPSDAFFVKGKNQNYWCHADVHDHRNIAYIKLYDLKSGKLIKDKRFMVICILEGHPIWIEDLKTQIDYFDGEKFHLKRTIGKDSCWLQ